MPREDTEPEVWELEASTVSQSRVGEELAAPRVPGLTILCHPDVRRVGERVALPALSSGKEVSLSRLEPLFQAPDGGPTRPLADRHLSRQPIQLTAESDHVVFRRAGVGTELEVGAHVVADEHRSALADLPAGLPILLARRIVLLLHELEPMATDGLPAYGLVGESAAMIRLRRQIQRVARHHVPVLLRGETGTGKELVAHAIHQAGPRREKPCVCLNMGAIPSTLAAAELFGSTKGAFTGAGAGRSGYFSQADGGTLFLDEIGETSAEIQSLLLRALETREIQPVGATGTITVDVRILAATDSHLERAIEEGRFRAPLLHRLAGYEIRLPPLRERRDDLGLLLFHFLRRELEAAGDDSRLRVDPAGRRVWPPARLVARLAAHDLPGNVRQLRNVAQQLVIAGPDATEPELDYLLDGLLGSAEPGPAVARRGSKPRAPSPSPASYRQPYEVTEEELLAALRAHRWRLKPAAASLDVSRTSLYALIDRCPRIRRASEIGRDEIEACRERCQGDLDAMADELEISRHGLQHRMREMRIGRT